MWKVLLYRSKWDLAPKVVKNDHANGTTMGLFNSLQQVDKQVKGDQLDTVGWKKEGCNGNAKYEQHQEGGTWGTKNSITAGRGVFIQTR